MRGTTTLGDKLPRTALRSLVLLAALAAPAWAWAADGAYTVSNYPVEASDRNAVAAKERALADGQRAAFRSLLKRLVPVTAYKQLTRLQDVNASDMISGVAVRSERNSATDYIANLDFSFQADEVRQALGRAAIPFVDEQAAPVTVITVLRQGNPANAANDTGNWRRGWAGLDLAHTVTPVKLADLKPEIHSDTVNMVLAGDDNGLRILSGEYQQANIVLAVAEPDLSAKKLVVTLAGRDAVGPIVLKRTYRVSQGDIAYASEFAAVVSLGILEGRWKAVRSAPVDAAAQDRPAWQSAAGSGGETVSFVAEFSSDAQWNEIRAQLLDTPGVDGLEISTVSDTRAGVSLRYAGGVRRLANALGARGLRLADRGDGWVLQSSY